MLNDAKCTSCGANVKVDPTKEAAVCEYCGAAFVVEKAINNYNIANAQITAQTVNVNVGMSDFIIEGGVLKKYKGNAKEVIIPNTVVIIDTGAFKDCASMCYVKIPDSVREIREQAFVSCSGLKEVVISNGVKTINAHWAGSHYNYATSGFAIGAFEYCPCLTDVSIPSSVDELSIHTFNGCTNLTNVKIEGEIFLTVHYYEKKIIQIPSGINTDIPYFALQILRFLQREKPIGDIKPVYVNGIDVVKKLSPLAITEIEAHTSSETDWPKIGYIALIIVGVIFVIWFLIAVF